LEQVLKAMLDVFITTPNRKLTPVWLKAYTSVLDTYLGAVPETVEVDGKILSPVDFAKSTGFNPDDYVEITSFTHHPYYEKFIFELPDNWSNDPYYNVPLNELLEIMNYSLQKGYTFVWDGDVGHEGFSHKNNVAVVYDGDYDFNNPKTEKEITVECRQNQFDNLTTTDDHLMHITALAEDQNGTMYYKTKNSWGDDSNDFGGYLYMSETYIRLNTIAIMVHKNAIPKEIKEKLGIK
jgi:bleomycin hydrolase